MSKQRPMLFRRPKNTTAPLPTATSAAIHRFHANLLPNNTQPTPLIPLPQLAHDLGVKAVFLKDESHRFGLPSFKILGASWGCFRAVCAALSMDYTTTSLVEVRRRLRLIHEKNEDLSQSQSQKAAKEVTLYTATEGNHGRAVAYMARLLGVRARVFVPGYMHVYTRECIERDGAEVVVVHGDYDVAVVQAAAEAKAEAETNGVLVQDTAWEGYEAIPGWIVDGYSTLMREIDEQLGQEHASVVVTPVGVGSLASAVARHCKSKKQATKVVAVEPAAGACLYESLVAGESVSVTTQSSIMNGSCCGTLSSTAWHVLQHTVDASVVVSDWESHQAVQYLQAQEISAGPCGASTLAALWRLAETGTDQNRMLDKDAVVVLLSTEGARPYPVPEHASSASTSYA